MLMNLASSIYPIDIWHLHSKLIFLIFWELKYELLGWRESTPLVVLVEEKTFLYSLWSTSPHLGLTIPTDGSWAWTHLCQLDIALYWAPVFQYHSFIWSRYEQDMYCNWPELHPELERKRIILSGELRKTQGVSKHCIFSYLLIEYLLPFSLPLLYPLYLHSFTFFWLSVNKRALYSLFVNLKEEIGWYFCMLLRWYIHKEVCRGLTRYLLTQNHACSPLLPASHWLADSEYQIHS